MKRTLSVLTAMLVFCQVFAANEKIYISGFIRDSESGETLIGAAAVSSDDGKGTVTNNFGRYSLPLERGPVEITFTYMGYEDYTVKIDLVRDTTLNISLKPSIEMLTGAVVTAQHSEVGVRGTQMSAIEVPVNQIKSVPALAGEVDLVKALQLLPGVQSGTEGAAGMYVRGGGPDENLLLLDGVPVYNVNHLFGFFSVFNADAVKNVTLYKGSFPARFGSRLSSVIDVRTKEGNDQRIKGSASIGLISSKINLEGPLVKGKTTFDISARRTYFDILTAPVIKKIAKENDADAWGGYYFYDLNGKITHRFSDKDKINISFYSGDDETYVKYMDEYNYHENYSTENTKLNWKWGNMIAAADWSHVFSPKLFMDAGINYTRYRHHLGLEVNYYDKYEGREDSETSSLGYDSGINDKDAHLEFEFLPSTDHDIRFGANYSNHFFNPSISSLKYEYIDWEEHSSIDTLMGDSKIYSNELAFYAEDNWSATDWLKINFGARYSLYSVSGKTYHSLEPRVSVRAMLARDLSFKASYTEMSQYVHMLSNSSLSLPTDLWVPVTQQVEPMRARQVAAGLFYSYDIFDFSVEGYYKTMSNVLEYKDGAMFLGSSTGWENKVAMGRGWSYGVEFLAQKKVGKLSGWIGYTWSRAWRQFDRPGNEINNGIKFPAKYDRIHDLSITAAYKFNDRIELSSTFIYGTGNTGSIPLEYIAAPNRPYSPVYDYEYLEGRNNFRMPSYSRIDIGANFYKQKKHGRRIWNVSVYNATNRNNPFIVHPDTDVVIEESPGEVHAYTVTKLKQLSIFPIIPSISYTYEF